VIDGVLVYVDDVDTHFAQAKELGANVLSEPEDGRPESAIASKTSKDIAGCLWRKIGGS
jgi:hypothetical protein